MSIQPLGKITTLKVGGTLDPRENIYIPRPEDDELFNVLLQGEYANILTSRQTGKSSLVMSTIYRLRDRALRTAYVDLTTIGTPKMIDDYYQGLLDKIKRDLKLTVDVADCWQSLAGETSSQRLMRFFRDIVCEAATSSVVIFLDEIDSTLKFDYTDDLFTALRAMYNERPLISTYKKLSFCLVGVATPNELIKDRHTTPYNIGTTLALRDFDAKRDDLAPLVTVLHNDIDTGHALLTRILHWSGGHPYLTIKLCQDLQSSGISDPGEIDKYIGLSFAKLDRISGDVHFDQISRFFQSRSTNAAAALREYERILNGARVNDQNLVSHTDLKLSGLVKRDNNGFLVIRNRIYKQLFDRRWLEAQIPLLFQVGGTIHHSKSIYIERPEDKALLGRLLLREYVGLFGPPQTGKSSMIARTAAALQKNGIRCGVIDLVTLGRLTDADDYFQALTESIVRRFDLDPGDWWVEHPQYPIDARLVRFFREVVAHQLASPIVIFLDDIESTLCLAFTGDLFAAISTMHRERCKALICHSITFCLSGVATLDALVKDRLSGACEMDCVIFLPDFDSSRDNFMTVPLLLSENPETGATLLTHVLSYTGGHPYLTMKLCDVIRTHAYQTTNDIDDYINTELSTMESARSDGHILTMERLLDSRVSDWPKLSHLYINVLQENTLNDRDDTACAELKLLGLVKCNQQGFLSVRNAIYARLFDRGWIEQSLPRQERTATIRSRLRSIIERARSNHVPGLSLVNQDISELPPDLFFLEELEHLDISYNALTVLPPGIGALKRLKTLNVSHNALTAVPAELGQLSVLEQLDLTNNALTTLPDSLEHIADTLEELALGGNRFLEIPPVIYKCKNLRRLWVNGNGIFELPEQFKNLRSLIYLNLADNRLNELPTFLGFMTHIKELDVDGVHLPPPEIAAQGTRAILGFLREWADGSEQRQMSKVLVVGDGGVGKTSVVRSLFGESWQPYEGTTHGINIRSLRLPHPEINRVDMELMVWDFGGQEIYHATHQFFFSDHSLFLLVWNARAGYEQCRVVHWLENIKALAPSSPVLLVASHADQRDADLPINLIRQRHENVVGQCIVSNVTGHGIPELLTAVSKTASTLPLMGVTWPRTWMRAADAIRADDRRYATPNQLRACMIANGVSEISWTTLAQSLHELGEILYFPNYDELRDTVILKPQWVVSYISKAVDDNDVVKNQGIFTKSEMERLWCDLAPHICAHLLALMERFDLSYRTLEDSDISLIVERLPLDPPDYMSRWKEVEDEPEIAMRFRLSAMPAGIPTWFIARAHRFTTGIHWRTGALFAYGPGQRHLAYTPEQTHLALIEASRYDRCVDLTVRGPHPHGFFSLLKDGLEVTFTRFPGLRIDRRIPCPGHQGNRCSHEFGYLQLLKRAEQGRMHIECPEGQEQVDVSALLFGLHWSTNNSVLARLEELRDDIRDNIYGHTLIRDGYMEAIREIKDLRELAQLGFTKTFRREQSKVESYCPNVFVLRPHDRARALERLTLGIFPWLGTWAGPSGLDVIAGQRIDLKLYCQAPGCWHPVQEGGQYEINEPPKWMQVMGPYIAELVKVLKFAAPLVGPWVSFVDKQTYEKNFKDDIEFMVKVSEKLPDLGKQERGRLVDDEGRIAEQETEMAKGAALRSLREFLDMRDPSHTWGNLRVVLTPEGHYLWLCEYHAGSYAALTG